MPAPLLPRPDPCARRRPTRRTYRCGPFPDPTFASVGFEAAGYYASALEPDHPLLSAAERRRRGRRLPPRRAGRRRIAPPAAAGCTSSSRSACARAWSSPPGRNDDRRLHRRSPCGRTSAGPAARMQEGRVLLDHEWNLNLDAAARAAECGGGATSSGRPGSPEGSDAFAGRGDHLRGAGPQRAAGTDVGRRDARRCAPAPFAYSAQDQIDAPPGRGPRVRLPRRIRRARPAGREPRRARSTRRSPRSTPRPGRRVGYRVRCRPTAAATCARPLAEVADPGLSERAARP